MELKILGTVSPYCKGTKNCPGYLVTSDNTKLLLDCGNGSARNLNLPADFENLSILLSHLHKDHYGDLLSLGYASYIYKNLGYLDERIKVYLPEPDYYDAIEYGQDADGWGTSRTVSKKISDYEYLENFGDEHFLEFETYNPNKPLTIGNLPLSFLKNPHPIKTYSTKIVENDSSLVYTGDTGYQGNKLATFAENADLLLCESTYLQGQQRQTDNHLYAREAGQIAKQANVKQLVLTHFFPELDSNLYVTEASKYFENTEAAEEGKVYKIGGRK